MRVRVFFACALVSAQSFLFAESGAQVHPISGNPSCASCRIEVAGRVSLGSRNDSVSVPDSPRVAVGRDGLFYAVSARRALAGPLIYDSRGALRRPMGRRGSGPGEFGPTSSVAVAPSGELYVRDIQTGLQVFGADGTFRRNLPLPHASFNMALIGDSVVAIAGGTRPAAAPDRSVHLYSAKSSKLIAGIGPAMDLRRDRPPALVFVAPSGADGLWLVQEGQTISRWTLAGTKTIQFDWQTGWLGQLDRRYARVPAQQAGPLYLVWEDTRNRLLWVLSKVADPDFKDTMAPLKEGAPIPPEMYSAKRYNDLSNSVVSVIDLARNVLISSTVLPESVYHWTEDGRAVVMQEATDGYAWIEVLSLRLTGFSR